MYREFVVCETEPTKPPSQLIDQIFPSFNAFLAVFHPALWNFFETTPTDWRKRVADNNDAKRCCIEHDGKKYRRTRRYTCIQRRVTRLRDFQERRIRPCRPRRFRVTLSSGWLFVCFSGEPALRSGSAMSRRFPRQQRTYAVQRAQFRSRPRYHYVLASGAVLQHLPVDDGR